MSYPLSALKQIGHSSETHVKIPQNDDGHATSFLGFANVDAMAAGWLTSSSTSNSSDKHADSKVSGAVESAVSKSSQHQLLLVGSSRGHFHVISVSEDAHFSVLESSSSESSVGHVVGMHMLDQNGRLIRPETLSPPISNNHDNIVGDRKRACILVVVWQTMVKLYALPSMKEIKSRKLIMDKAVKPKKKQLGDGDYAQSCTVAEAQDSSGDSCLIVIMASGVQRVLSLVGLEHVQDDALPENYVDTETGSLKRGLRISHNNSGRYVIALGTSHVGAFTALKPAAGVVVSSNDMTGSLHNDKVKIPKKPDVGFFKSLFGSGISEIDRHLLFGDKKPEAGVNDPIVPKCNIEAANSAVGSVARDMEEARMKLMERGEKVSELADKSAQMSDDARRYRDASSQLKEKMRKQSQWF